MADDRIVLPPCGHVERETQLTEIHVPNTMGNIVTLLVCTVPDCPEYCVVFVDLRDPEPEPDDLHEPSREAF